MIETNKNQSQILPDDIRLTNQAPEIKDEDSNHKHYHVYQQPQPTQMVGSLLITNNLSPKAKSQEAPASPIPQVHVY